MHNHRSTRTHQQLEEAKRDPQERMLRALFVALCRVPPQHTSIPAPTVICCGPQAGLCSVHSRRTAKGTMQTRLRGDDTVLARTWASEGQRPVPLHQDGATLKPGRQRDPRFVAEGQKSLSRFQSTREKMSRSETAPCMACVRTLSGAQSSQATATHPGRSAASVASTHTQENSSPGSSPEEPPPPQGSALQAPAPQHPLGVYVRPALEPQRVRSCDNTGPHQDNPWV